MKVGVKSILILSIITIIGILYFYETLRLEKTSLILIIGLYFIMMTFFGVIINLNTDNIIVNHLNPFKKKIFIPLSEINDVTIMRLSLSSTSTIVFQTKTKKIKVSCFYMMSDFKKIEKYLLSNDIRCSILTW